MCTFIGRTRKKKDLFEIPSRLRAKVHYSSNYSPQSPLHCDAFPSSWNILKRNAWPHLVGQMVVVWLSWYSKKRKMVQPMQLHVLSPHPKGNNKSMSNEVRWEYTINEKSVDFSRRRVVIVVCVPTWSSFFWKCSFEYKMGNSPFFFRFNDASLVSSTLRSDNKASNSSVGA